ncbi:MAG: PspC domain-containing protein [Chitinophagaceae bacterium]
MNRVIHINFQGSVIPIEESAADLLREYIADLRAYFAPEEGCDEIIGDIESRIAELFLQKLKKGAACITDADMREIMAGIGMPADLEAAASDPSEKQSSHSGNHPGDPRQSGSSAANARLFRAANDKICGGVAAGIAYHFNIDPAIVRVLFVFSMFAGFGIAVYLVLWIVLPKQDIWPNEDKRRRLFRNMEDKKIGGVASGIAAYFDIAVWIPRVLFLAPLILALIDSRLDFFDGFTDFIFPGFGGSLFVLYFVLWAVVPAANTAAQKLQMRGEKVDLNSIQKTVNEELEQLKTKAERWGKDAGKRFQDKAREMQQDLSGTTRNFYQNAQDTGRRGAKGVGYGLGVFAKVIAYGLILVITVALLLSFGGLFTGMAAGHQSARLPSDRRNRKEPALGSDRVTHRSACAGITDMAGESAAWSSRQ